MEQQPAHFLWFCSYIRGYPNTIDITSFISFPNRNKEYKVHKILKSQWYPAFPHNEMILSLPRSENVDFNGSYRAVTDL